MFMFFVNTFQSVFDNSFSQMKRWNDPESELSYRSSSSYSELFYLMAKLWEIVCFWVNYIPLNVKEFHYLCNYEEERLSEVLMPDILPHSW